MDFAESEHRRLVLSEPAQEGFKHTSVPESAPSRVSLGSDAISVPQ